MGLEQIKVEMLNLTGNDHTITSAALTSTGKEISEERHLKLLKKLVDEGHHSCFEHVTMQFSLTVPLFIATQILRHRVGFSFNQASVRYSFNFKEFYLPEVEEASLELIEDYVEICKKAVNLYQEIKEHGTKRELETFGRVLPQSIMTKLTLTCNLRSFLHFYQLRSNSHAQEEIQYLAKKMLTLLKETGKIDSVLGYLGL